MAEDIVSTARHGSVTAAAQRPNGYGINPLRHFAQRFDHDLDESPTPYDHNAQLRSPNGLGNRRVASDRGAEGPV